MITGENIPASVVYPQCMITPSNTVVNIQSAAVSEDSGWCFSPVVQSFSPLHSCRGTLYSIMDHVKTEDRSLHYRKDKQTGFSGYDVKVKL